jgi:hypothetical protein
VFIFLAMNKLTGSGGDDCASRLAGESHLVPKGERWSRRVTSGELVPRAAPIPRRNAHPLRAHRARSTARAGALRCLDDSGSGGEHEFRQQLSTRLRGDGPPDPNAPWNVDYDSVDYAIERADGKTCEFTYRDDKVEIRRSVRSTGGRTSSRWTTPSRTSMERRERTSSASTRSPGG